MSINKILKFFKNTAKIEVPFHSVNSNTYSLPHGLFWLGEVGSVSDATGSQIDILAVNSCPDTIVLSNRPVNYLVFNIQSIIGSLSDVDRFLNNTANVNRFIWCVENFTITKGSFYGGDEFDEIQFTYFLFERYNFQALTSEQHYERLSILEQFNDYILDNISKEIGEIKSAKITDFNRASILTHNLEKENIIGKAYTGIMIELNVNAFPTSCC